MGCPLALFTGPWADLPLDELAGLAAGWSYRAVELAAWGDHLEVQRCLGDPAALDARADLLRGRGLEVTAVSCHRVSAAICEVQHGGLRHLLPEYVWGDGEPEGIRQRAVSEVIATARVASIAYLVRRAKELNPQLDLIEPPLDGLTIQGARHLELEPDYYPIDVKTPAPDPEVVALLSKVNGDVRMNSWRSLDTLWATPGYFGTGNFNNVIGLKNLVSQSWYAARKASGKLGADAAADATRTNYLSLLHNAASSVLSSPVGIPTPIDTLSQGRLKNPDALPDADMQGFTITKLAIQLKQVAKDEEGRDGRDRNLRRALKMSEMSEALHLRATESKARHALK